MKKATQVILLCFTVFYVSELHAQEQSLFINEFVASNSSYTDEFGETDDWVELYNAGDTEIDIGGMYVTDDLIDTTKWRILSNNPAKTTIAPGGFLLLWFDNTPEQGVLHVDSKLSAGGEDIGLFDTDGQTPLDSITFGQQAENISYGRVTDGADSWKTFSIPTPGMSNNNGGGPALFINEFLAQNSSFPDEFGEADDWVELYNAGDTEVDIGGMFVTDDLDDTTKSQIPSNNPVKTTIAPGGFLMLWFDNTPEQGVLHVNAKLGADGEDIGLYNIDGQTRLDSITFGQQTENISYGRVTDGADSWKTFSTPTPGSNNSETTNVNDETQLNSPLSYSLGRNFPNPFNQNTVIPFSLPHDSKVSIDIYTVTGQLVTTLVSGYETAGNHCVDFDAAHLSSGIYYYYMHSGKFHTFNKMTLLK